MEPHYHVGNDTCSSCQCHTAKPLGDESLCVLAIEAVKLAYETEKAKLNTAFVEELSALRSELKAARAAQKVAEDTLAGYKRVEEAYENNDWAKRYAALVGLVKPLLDAYEATRGMTASIKNEVLNNEWKLDFAPTSNPPKSE
jgi:hypothetical protein